MSSSSPLDLTLKTTMRNYLDDFFVSLQGDKGSLKLFLGKLSTFSTTIRAHRHRLQEETLMAARNFANVVDSVVTGMLDLEKASEGDEFRTDITKVLNEKMSCLSISDRKSDNTSHPAYIYPSYRWLLSNLHNPYPSKDVKKRISSESKCSVKDIDAWFVDTRKRIGWNRLRKTKFSNKQEKIISAATHFFQPKLASFSDDLHASLISETDSRDAYHRDFVGVAHKAKSLYADKYPELASPAFLHSVGNSSKKVKNDNWDTSFSPQIVEPSAMFSYPTPEPSPSLIPENLPSPTSLSDPDICQSHFRKRRYSTSNTDEIEDEATRNHPSKRSRLEINQYEINEVVANLPSPSNTIDSTTEFDTSALEVGTTESVVTEAFNLKRKRRLSEESERPSKFPHITSSPKLVVTESPIFAEVTHLKRKRRLSDGESQCPPKRPHHALAVPRLQTVSDPFPLTKRSLFGPLETSFQDGGVLEHDPNRVPSPIQLKDTVPLTAPLEVCHGQYDVPATYPESCSEEYLSYFVNEEHSASLYPFDNSELFSGLVAPSLYQDTLQNSSSNLIISTPNFPDFNGLLSGPEYDLSLPTQFMSMSEDLSHWFASMQSDSYDPLNPSDSTPSETAINHVAYTDSLDAKRARLQALKEQVSQLEGQLAEQF